MEPVPVGRATRLAPSMILRIRNSYGDQAHVPISGYSASNSSWARAAAANGLRSRQLLRHWMSPHWSVRVPGLVHPVRVQRARRPNSPEKLAEGIDQGVAACVVETVWDLHMIWVELIAQLEKPEGLPGADCARAQHPIDRDALLSKIAGWPLAGGDVCHPLMAASADSTVCTGTPVDTSASMWAAKRFGVTSSAPFSLGSTPWYTNTTHVLLVRARSAALRI